MFWRHREEIKKARLYPQILTRKSYSLVRENRSKELLKIYRYLHRNRISLGTLLQTPDTTDPFNTRIRLKKKNNQMTKDQ